MTALDQAFIKAYVRHGATPAGSRRDSARPVQLDEALNEKTLEPPAKKAPARRATDVPAGASAGPSKKGKAKARNGASAKSSAARRARSGKASAAPAPGPQSRPVPETQAGAKSVAAGGGVSCAALLDSAAAAPQAALPALPQAAGADRADAAKASAPEPVSAMPLPSEAAKAVKVAQQVNEPPPRLKLAATPDPRDVSDFQPLLEVDRVAWPTVVSRMDGLADGALGSLADALMDGASRGQKVIALAGCHRGEGCTTVALATARRLAARGARVILVDADFERPRVARRLGLAPQVGWEEVLCGRVPLAEAVIQSLHDRLDLLPVREPLSDAMNLSGEPWDPSSIIGVLREHYDLVLLDLGRVSKWSKSGVGVFASAARWIDAVILVHNLRSTPPLELTQAWQRLSAAGIVEVAVVENFT